MTDAQAALAQVREAMAAGPTRLPIPSAPGYEADASGRVWSVASNWRGLGPRALTPFYDDDGYLRVRIVVSGGRKKAFVHRMVCEAFHGPQPDGHEVRHLDGTRVNNVPGNLAWGTRSENAKDRQAHGTDRAAENGLLGAEATRRRFSHLAVEVTCRVCGNRFNSRQWKVAAASRRGVSMTCSVLCARRLGGIATARGTLRAAIDAARGKE